MCVCNCTPRTSQNHVLCVISFPCRDDFMAFTAKISVTCGLSSAFIRVRAEDMNDNSQYIQQLLTEARSGSRESTKRLALILRKRLYAFVLRTTLSREMTEKILQETLLAVLRQVPSHQNDHAIWPWVFGIAWSRIQDNPGRHQRMPGPQLKRPRSSTNAACSATA